MAIPIAPATGRLGVLTPGLGAVASTFVTGVDCGADCEEDFDYGTSVTLTATAETGTSSFRGWGGACTGASIRRRPPGSWRTRASRDRTRRSCIA